MAGRKYTKMYPHTWQESSFRALSPCAQRLYWLLLAQPNRSACGVLPLQLSKWAKFSVLTTPRDISTHLYELESAGIVVVDQDTEEVLIRNFLRDDIADEENPPSWKVQKGAARTCLSVESASLRSVLADELESLVPRLRAEVVESIADLLTTLRPIGFGYPSDSLSGDTLSMPNRTTTTTTTTTPAEPRLSGGSGGKFSAENGVTQNSISGSPDFEEILDEDELKDFATSVELCKWCEQKPVHPRSSHFCSPECQDGYERVGYLRSGTEK